MEEVKKWKLFDANLGVDSAREVREYFIPDFSDWNDHDSYQTAFQQLVKDLKILKWTVIVWIGLFVLSHICTFGDLTGQKRSGETDNAALVPNVAPICVGRGGLVVCTTV